MILALSAAALSWMIRPGYTEEPLLRVGETLKYQVYGQGIPIGEQIFRVISETDYEGYPVYHIRMELRSYPVISIFFNYRETDELYLDQALFFPRFLRREVMEQGKSRVEEYRFRIEENMIIYSLIGNDGIRQEKVFSAEEPCLESFSLNYYLRTRPWEKENYTFFFLSPEGPQAVRYHYRGREELKSRGMLVTADKIEDPLSKTTIWFSPDKEAYPLFIRVTKDFGNLDSRLSSVE